MHRLSHTILLRVGGNKMYIVTAEEMYELDKLAMKEGGIDGRILIENAGSAIYEKLVNRVSKKDKIAVVVGGGNNGGDGFVIARYLKENGFTVHVLQLVADERIKGDALFHKELYMRAGNAVTYISSRDQFKAYLAEADVLVDAILGIGMNGEIREPIRTYIELINNSNLLTLSIDIPSGLPSNEGMHLDKVVRADITYTVEAWKQAFLCESFAKYCGVIETVDIGIPKAAYTSVKPTAKIWTSSSFRNSYPRREPYSYKGANGKGLIIGGNQNMPGAAMLSARAALRAGAGLLSVATVPENRGIIAAGCPEATYHILPNFTRLPDEDTIALFQTFDGIAIGMGMGRKESSSSFIQAIMEQTNVPLLIDADGLYHFKRNMQSGIRREGPIIITPHFGEMAMLTETTIEEVKRNPFALSRKLAERYNLHVVLKGKHTIITAPNGEQLVSNEGNPGLAKGGTGDVLSGILLTMIMQHEEILPALANGCFLHGKSAELLISEGKHSIYDVVASDIVDGLPFVFRTFLEA